MKYTFTITVASTLALIRSVHSHSHVECTDVSDSNECRGYARYYSTNKAGYEGTDQSKDRNDIVSAGTRTCPIAPGPVSEMYIDKYPMAHVNAGQKVKIQWPPRGHQKQQSSPVWIYCANTPSSMFPLTGDGYSKIAEVPYIGDCHGDDISWAKCYGEYMVPTNFTQGTYNCYWYWILNGGQEYLDCFDISVGNTAAPSAVTSSVSDSITSTHTMSANAPLTSVSSIMANVLKHLGHSDDTAPSPVESPATADPTSAQIVAVGGGQDINSAEQDFATTAVKQAVSTSIPNPSNFKILGIGAGPSLAAIEKILPTDAANATQTTTDAKSMAASSAAAPPVVNTSPNPTVSVAGSNSSAVSIAGRPCLQKLNSMYATSANSTASSSSVSDIVSQVQKMLLSIMNFAPNSTDATPNAATTG